MLDIPEETENGAEIALLPSFSPSPVGVMIYSGNKKQHRELQQLALDEHTFDAVCF